MHGRKYFLLQLNYTAGTYAGLYFFDQTTTNPLSGVCFLVVISLISTTS